MPKSLRSREHLLLIGLLRDLRLAAGLDQIEVAESLSRPQSFVSKYETGERRLDVIELRICGVLGVSLTDFAQQLERRIEDPEAI